MINYEYKEAGVELTKLRLFNNSDIVQVWYYLLCTIIMN